VIDDPLDDRQINANARQARRHRSPQIMQDKRRRQARKFIKPALHSRPVCDRAAIDGEDKFGAAFRLHPEKYRKRLRMAVLTTLAR
jgi:hypothetical protein